KFAKREFIPGYNILINHYKSKNDTINQLFYAGQITKHISTVMEVTNGLYPIINQRYTVANIKRQQERDKRNLFLEILLIGGAILLSISLGYRYYIYHYSSPKNLLPETTTDSTKQN